MNFSEFHNSENDAGLDVWFAERIAAESKKIITRQRTPGLHFVFEHHGLQLCLHQSRRENMQDLKRSNMHNLCHFQLKQNKLTENEFTRLRDGKKFSSVRKTSLKSGQNPDNDNF